MNENLLYRGLDLSGLVAGIVFIGSAFALFIFGVISEIIALVRGGWTKAGFRSQGAFGFLVSAFVLGAIDLVFFGIFYLFGNFTSTNFREILDALAFYGWLPLQPVLWIAAAIIFNKRRKTT